MYELAKLGGFLISPLTLALGLWLLSAACLLLRRRAWALGCAATAFLILWVASLPVVAQSLAMPLESRYAAVPVAESPSADAILVLGGALAGASPPRRPSFNLGPAAGRVWHAADLYRAGKARWVVIAAGNQPGQEAQEPEAEAIARMLAVLGVPAGAIKLEGRSRNTRENAANAAALIQQIGAKRVLLVTSARHMPRALKTLANVWEKESVHTELVPSVTDVSIPDPYYTLKAWLPSVQALEDVTATLKEYAGGWAVGII